MRSDDLQLAEELARGAGNVLLALRESHGSRVTGSAGDREANRYLLDVLTRERPDDAVLSEEAADDPRRRDSDRVWIIDPLDGTREFAEQSGSGVWRDDFAVHIALWTRAAGLSGGVVGIPARGVIYRSDRVSHPGPPASGRPLRMAVSRSRPPSLVKELRRHIPVEFRPMGSAGVKVMAVVSGDADAYVHAGGQYEWDSAAPAAVALGAGLHASRLDGSPLVYNRADPWLPDLLVCDKQTAPMLLGLFAKIEGN